MSPNAQDTFKSRFSTGRHSGHQPGQDARMLGTDPVATLRMTTVSQMAASAAIVPASRPSALAVST
jgi:hypothetical protein